ncbi:MAG: fused MFS/spermidine synthase, partial [Planctomycetes bacterium]|nr:fused MFS/spermidine synthase [Planctomycetota bacterium]
MTDRTETPATPGEGDASRRSFLYFVALAAGAAGMALEMTAQRALAPHFGSSTYIWANVIGILLAGLSLGYWAGGRLADRRASPSLLLGLLGAVSVWAALVPLVVHPLGRACIPEGTPAEHSFRINLLGSFLCTLLLFGPPVVLLGAAQPFLVRLLSRDPGETGRTAGRVNAFSAVGSLAGTFAPTLVLIPALGTRLAFTACAAALAALAAGGALLFARGRPRYAAALLLLPLLPSALLGRGPVNPDPGTLEESESPYQYIRVYEREGRRFLTMNEGRDQFHSLQVEGKALTEGQYFDYLNLVPLHFDPAMHPSLRICVVGLAAGVYSRQAHHFFGGMFRVEIDGAEIDPSVLAAGRRHFGLDGPLHRNLAAAAADGRIHLASSQGGYDLVAVDAYSRQLYIPFHLITEEFFRLCAEKLRPGGFVAVNVCDFGERSPALSAVRNTCARVFGTAYLLRLPRTMNHLLYARKGSLPADLDRVRENLLDPAFA